MADEKIRVSWDEVNSPEVDQKVKQQEMLGRMQDHYQQQAPPPLPGQTSVSTQQLPMPVWRNTIVYMSLFGLMGGIAAWVIGECVFALFPNRLEEFWNVLLLEQAIQEKVVRGEISQQQANLQYEALRLKYQDNPYVRIVADESLSASSRERQLEDRIKKDRFQRLVQQLLWFSLLAVPLAFCLGVADQVVGRNWRAFVINGSIAIALGVLGGIVVSLFINRLYNAMGGGQDADLSKQIMARSIGWAILGLFLSIAPGIVLKNWKRFGIGLAGGLLGGLFGGILFDPILMVTQSVAASRFVCIVAIGTAAGAGTGLIESVAKSGWLRVVGGLIAGKQFIIYKNPTYLGSSPRCEVYLFKDPQVGPQHAAIHTVPGGYELEDLRSPTGTFVNGSPVSRVRLRGNDHIQIGATVLLFQEKERVDG